MVGTELDQIVEDVSQEQSRILNSGDLDSGNKSNSRAPSQGAKNPMADIFAQSQQNQESKAPSNNGGGALAGIFEQSAAA